MNIIHEIREEIAAAQRPPSGRDLTVLALLFAAVGCGVGAYYVILRGSNAGLYWVVGGVALGSLRLIPSVFGSIYRVWVGFSIIIGYFVSRFILMIIFFIVMIPTGLLMRVLGKDPMDRKWARDSDSYWIKRSPEEDRSIERYEKQF
jgi:hypothetical protein